MTNNVTTGSPFDLVLTSVPEMTDLELELWRHEQEDIRVASEIASIQRQARFEHTYRCFDGISEDNNWLLSSIIFGIVLTTLSVLYYSL